LTAVCSSLCLAQDAAPAAAAAPAVANPWKIDLNANVTMTMNTYSNNWVGGDAGSMSWASQINGAFEKQLNAKLLNQNKLRLAFGQTVLQDKTTKDWSDPQKSTDLIDLEATLRFTLGILVDPYLSVRGISQFVDSRDTLLERYFNPWDISETFGVARDVVKSERVNWNARVGLGARQSIDRDKLVSVITEVEKRETEVNNDGGAELVSELKATNKAGWLTYTSLLKVFDALISTKASEAALAGHENDWRYPHMNWEHIVVMNLTKYVMINYYMQLLYDRELDRDVRFKQTLSLGLTYTYKK
jgi:hypothetical protein